MATNPESRAAAKRFRIAAVGGFRNDSEFLNNLLEVVVFAVSLY
jgi:hypothetical protein